MVAEQALWVRRSKLFPTDTHRKVTERAVDLLSRHRSIEAIILTCSCARGLGSRDIDYAAFVTPGTSLEEIKYIESEWYRAINEDITFKSFRQTGPFFQLDLWVTDGQFQPKYQPHLLSHGPDCMELDIGNLYMYSKPLSGNLDRFNQTKESLLPYYSDELRNQRLTEARNSALESAEYVAWDHGRGHHYLALKRLQTSFEYFLHGLFISKRIYPIAYDKWLQEQFRDLLNMPQLYGHLTNILKIPEISGDSLNQSADQIKKLVGSFLNIDS